MKKNVRKGLHVVLASTMIASPFVMVPKAHASTDFYVDVDNEVVDEESEYDMEFVAENDLDEDDTIKIEFDSAYDLDEADIDEDTITVNEESPKKVSVSGQTVTITLDSSIDEEEDVTIHFDSILNPDEEGDYTIQLKATGDSSWEEEEVTIEEEDEDEDEDDDDSSDEEFSVELDSYETGEDTGVELGEIELEDDLEEGEWVYVTFPSDDMLPNSIDEGDVEINGFEPDDVTVSGDDEVKIKVPEDADGDSDLTITFSEDAGIQNPEDEDEDYTFDVKYDGTTYTSEEVEITDDGSTSSSGSSSKSTSGEVILSNRSAGERSSYTLDLDFGNKDISSGSTISVEFPSADMLPGYIESQYVTINGKTMKSGVYPSGKTVSITTPNSFVSTNKVKIVFSYYSYISNPKTAGSYQMKATAAGKTVTSKSFEITGTSVTPTTPTTPTIPTTPTNPTPVNNMTATVGLTKSTLNTPTGLSVGIKGLGMPLVKNRDFLEVSLPSGFRVPAYVNAAAVSVNGSIPSFVTTRGQNLVIYPSQDISANAAVNVVVGEASNIVTPAYASNYTIGVYSSEEKNALFTRTVAVGGAAPAVTLPANAARVKLNVASFTLNGKAYPLAAAPYTLNSNTMVPAQFFKEALSLTTVWSPTAASITSGQTQIKFTVGSNIAKVNNVNVKLPVAVQVKNGVPMLPMRMIADTLKFKLGWEAKTSSIVMYR